MSVIFTTPPEAMKMIAKQAKERRLLTNWTQKTLAYRSGVSLGAIKRFETTGKISLGSLLKIALVLGCLESFLPLFTIVPEKHFKSINDMIKSKTRLRARE